MKKAMEKGIFILKWGTIGLLSIFITVIFLLLFADPSGKYDHQHNPTSDKTVTVIMVDGLSQKIFQDAMMKNELPYLKQLIAQSTYVINGISSFPSMTGYGFYPFITGKSAHESGIYGLRWFDRSRDTGNFRNYVGRTNIHMNNDIKDSYSTLFEFCKSYYTASINTYMNRGVHDEIFTSWAHTTSKFHHYTPITILSYLPFIGNRIAKNHFQHETLVTDLAINQLKKNPKVQFITYPSLDAYNHVHGLDDGYKNLLSHIDLQIGRIINAVKEYNQTDRMIAIVTDHGVADVHKNVDIPYMYGRDIHLQVTRGNNTNIIRSTLEASKTDFENKDGFFVINGNLSAYLYLKKPGRAKDNSWAEKLYGNEITNYRRNNKMVNIPDYTMRIPGVDIVAFADNRNSVRVLSNRGDATITRTVDGSYNYKITYGDPLNIGTSRSNLFANDIMTISENSEYPYAIPRLYDLMIQHDGPDMVISMLPEYDLAPDYEIIVDEYKGGHGGIHRSMMSVPYILFMPDHPPQTIANALAEDIGVTIFDYLNIKPEYDLSGIPLRQ